MRKKILIIAIVLLALAGVTLFVLERTGVTDLYQRQTSSSPTETGEIPGTKPTNTINYGPASDADTTPIPDKNPETTQQVPVNSALSATITSIRANSSKSAYLVKVAVAGTDTGTCSLVARQGEKSVTAQSTIGKDPSGQTGCINLSVNTKDLINGEWNFSVTVSDAAGATASTSDTAIIEL